MWVGTPVSEILDLPLYVNPKVGLPSNILINFLKCSVKRKEAGSKLENPLRSVTDYEMARRYTLTYA